MRDLHLALSIPAALLVTCQHNPLQNWKYMWNVLKTVPLNLWDLKQDYWCSVHCLPPLNSNLEYTSGDFYILEKSHTIEKTLQYFRHAQPAHVNYEVIRTPRSEFSWYDIQQNHLFFGERIDHKVPTSPNLVNKQNRLKNTHSFTLIENILTK